MRDFLDDAHQHRTDGYGRAQAHVKQQLPKRFYKATSVVPAAGGFAVELDGRATKTPGRKPVIVPVAALATALAEEWAAQGQFIDPATMPLQRLVNSTIEAGAEQTVALREEILKFCASDLLLYRADGPVALVADQERLWDAALVKLARHFGVGFQPTIGIIHQAQPPATLSKLGLGLDGENHWVLTPLLSVTALTGSGLLAIALWEKLVIPDEVWAAAHVDEDFNIAQWGEVEEHTVRRAQRRTEFDAAVGMLETLRV